MKHSFCENSCIPSRNIEYHQVEIYVNFQRKFSKIYNCFPNSRFGCNNSKDLTYITLSRLVLSLLCYGLYKQFFYDTLHPFFKCGFEVERPLDYLLYNTAHHNEGLTLVNKTKNISINFLEKYARTLDD